MTTPLKYETNFGSVTYQTHAIQSIQIVKLFVNEQGLNKGLWEMQGDCIERNMI